MVAGEFYSRDELVALGFASVGDNVRVSRKVSLYAISGSIGSNVRIDDFAILKGHIELGCFVHIAAHCLITGVRGVVRLADCATLSDSVSVYTGSDDYRADALSSSTVPREYLATITGDVTLGRGVIVGSHSVILPGTTLGDGASVGALCVIHGSFEAGSIIVSGAATPRIVGKRNVDKIQTMVRDLTSAVEQKS